MRRFRFLCSVRGMIVVTAVVGLILGGYLLRQRAVAFRQRLVVLDRCEKGCERYRTWINHDLQIIETNDGGEDRLQAARNLEGMISVRKRNRGDVVTSEDKSRRFAKTFTPERISLLIKLGHEEYDFYGKLAESYRWNRKIYEKAARYPWMSASGTVPEPR